MSKTFTYTKITERVYLKNTDEWEEFGEEFEYEVDESDLLSAVVDLVYKEYFSTNDFAARGGIMKFIDDHDLLDELVDEYEEELKDYFEDEAMDSYEV